MQVRRGSTSARLVALGLAVALLAASCGGKKAGSSQQESAQDKQGVAQNSGRNESLGNGGKTPVRGGTLNVGLGGETPGGYCLPEAQLASGIQVAVAIYDTLTAPDDKGNYVPFLAKSVTHSADYKTWDITLRKGITFQDGTPLTPEVVKDNLDAYRGTYPTRHPQLFIFTFGNIATTAVKGPDTVEVTTKVPWVDFPAYLYGTGRVGIMAKSQLDDTKTCDRKLVGTGPFMLKSWKVGTKMVVVRNPHYWIKAPDGKPYPYLKQINFLPISDEGQRLNALEAGEIDTAPTILGSSVTHGLALQKKGKAEVNVLPDPLQTGHLMFNASRPPFDNPIARKAIAYASNAKFLNDTVNDGVFKLATGPFGPGSMGYVAETGQPHFNLPMAKKLVKQYEQQTGKKFSFVLNTLPDPTILQIAQIAQQQFKQAGVSVKLNTEDQATLINDAIGGSFEASLWTNTFASGDPDGNYVWWYSTSPVNFGRIKDPIIDHLLDEGRSEPNPTKRAAIYKALDREFGKQNWNIWTYFTTETLVVRPDVHGILPPTLPDGSKPYDISTAGDPLYAAWKG